MYIVNLFYFSGFVDHKQKYDHGSLKYVITKFRRHSIIYSTEDSS